MLGRNGLSGPSRGGEIGRFGLEWRSVFGEFWVRDTVLEFGNFLKSLMCVLVSVRIFPVLCFEYLRRILLVGHCRLEVVTNGAGFGLVLRASASRKRVESPRFERRRVTLTPSEMPARPGGAACGCRVDVVTHTYIEAGTRIEKGQGPESCGYLGYWASLLDSPLFAEWSRTY